MHLCMDSCLFPRKEFTSLIMCINMFFFAALAHVGLACTRRLCADVHLYSAL